MTREQAAVAALLGLHLLVALVWATLAAVVWRLLAARRVDGHAEAVRTPALDRGSNVAEQIARELAGSVAALPDAAVSARGLPGWPA